MTQQTNFENDHKIRENIGWKKGQELKKLMLIQQRLKQNWKEQELISSFKRWKRHLKSIKQPGGVEAFSFMYESLAYLVQIRKGLS